jgi:uncharacterized peroxidase-related enzyme
MRHNYQSAPLTNRERAILDYAVKLTETPWVMREEDLVPMRAAGLSDRDILDVNLITAYFAYVNRVADGLGVSVDSYVSEDEQAEQE